MESKSLRHLIVVLLPALCSTGLALYASATPVDDAKPQVIKFEGSVERLEEFEKTIGPHLVFKLTPDDAGWSISIMAKNGAQEKNRAICTPTHGDSGCDISAECIDAKTNAHCHYQGPIGHEFQIGLGKNIPYSEEQKKQDNQWWRYPNYQRIGTGILTIDSAKLGKAPGKEDAVIDELKFRVEIKLP